MVDLRNLNQKRFGAASSGDRSQSRRSDEIKNSDLEFQRLIGRGFSLAMVFFGSIDLRAEEGDLVEVIAAVSGSSLTEVQAAALVFQTGGGG